MTTKWPADSYIYNVNGLLCLLLAKEITKSSRLMFFTRFRLKCFIQTHKHWRGNEGCWWETAEWGQKGWKSRPKAESGGRVLGEGTTTSSPLPTSYKGVWGSAVNSPSGVGAPTATAQRFPLFSALRDGLSWDYNIVELWITRNWTRSSADADKPARCVKVTKHGTIRYFRYGFLLVCYNRRLSHPKLAG